jgi:hypothetical protein
MMWAEATDELVQMPLPARWDPAARKRHLATIAKAALPLSSKAKAAATACVGFSVKFQWTDEASAACGAWLTKSYRAESPPLDELLLPRPLRATGPASIHDLTAPLDAAPP